LSTFGVHMHGDASTNMLMNPGVVESIFVFRDSNLWFCEDLVGLTRTGKFFTLDTYEEELVLHLLVDPRSSLLFGRYADFHVVNYVPSLISSIVTLRHWRKRTNSCLACWTRSMLGNCVTI